MEEYPKFEEAVSVPRCRDIDKESRNGNIQTPSEESPRERGVESEVLNERTLARLLLGFMNIVGFGSAAIRTPSRFMGRSDRGPSAFILLRVIHITSAVAHYPLDEFEQPGTVCTGRLLSKAFHR